jgi:hypothetical protein
MEMQFYKNIYVFSSKCNLKAFFTDFITMIFSKKYQIGIGAPCQEKWEEMLPMGTGRFCDSCSKNVVDFSVMSEKEIVSFFKNKSSHTCGRFTSDQLDKTYIQKPEFKLPFHQRFLSFLFSLFVSNTVINKANAQDSIQIVQNDSLEKFVKTDTSISDTSVVNADSLSDSTEAKLKFVVDNEFIVDTEIHYEPVNPEGIFVMGDIYEPRYSYPWDFRSPFGFIDSLWSTKSVIPKVDIIVQNDNPIPRKEPIKREAVISDAVLPEELKRKLERE